jgi:hypothetical protein
MCVNYQTSIAAFVIGEITGLILIFDQDKSSTNYDKIFIGLFVMFYSLIQFFELMLYLNKSNDNNQIYKKMLALNLGFQGLVFFLLASYIYKVNSIYLIICGMVSFLIMLSVFQNDIGISFTESNCLRWDFLSNLPNINISLSLMYFIIFLWVFTESNSEYIKYIGFVLLGTFIFSYYILSGKANSPGLWCLSSAIAAPLFLLQ